MTRMIASLLVLIPFTAGSAFAQPGNQAKIPAGIRHNPIPTASRTPARSVAVVALIKDNDHNGDGRLNADECPAPFRPSFSKLDLNRDGYLDEAEFTLGFAGGFDRNVVRGKVVANFIYLAADDFVVEIYHNGAKVADSRRSLLAEVFGATTEKDEIEVREGDWLVFNVVNNRFRWDGSSYFAAAGMKVGAGVGFVSDPASHQWSCCDDPEQVAAFIASPGHLADQKVTRIERKWAEGDPRMNSLTDGWKGEAVWGKSRNTWLKYVAPKPDGDASPKH